MFKVSNLQPTRFDHFKLIFGAYLGFACLPVGRGFWICDLPV